MKTTITIALILVASLCFAQQPQKHLPKQVKFTLTDQQTIQFAAKIDSIMALLANTSNAPATQVNSFISRFNSQWINLINQVYPQMVADTPKVAKKK